MLALTRKLLSARSAFALLAVVLLNAFTSCATKQEPALVSTGDQRESSLPWNQQEKWENRGQFGPMADRFEGSR